MDNLNDSIEKNKKWKKHIPLYIIEALLLICAVLAFFVVNKITDIKKVNVDGDSIVVNDRVKEDAETFSGHVFNADTDAVPDMPDEEKEALYEELYKKYNGSFDMAFFGVDSRLGELGAGTRSDSIMICHIDMESREVKLISIYRDTYLNIGNDKYNKCNAAYAKGGPEGALSMINMNTDMYITDYVTVGFEGLIGAIDALDGVTIYVEEDEIFHLNNYQISMADELGMDYTPVVYAGWQSLNGLQATAYCRIRYTKGDDFKRAERQRAVVAAMLEKSKQVKLSKLTEALTAILPNVQTSLSVSSLAQMMSLASDYTVTVSDGFPFAGMRNGGNMGTVGDFVVPVDLTDNVKRLHELLFDDAEYEPSDDVKRYSGVIKSDTEGHLLY